MRASRIDTPRSKGRAETMTLIIRVAQQQLEEHVSARVPAVEEFVSLGFAGVEEGFDVGEVGVTL
jgi:hypothetical protein